MPPHFACKLYCHVFKLPCRDSHTRRSPTSGGVTSRTKHFERWVSYIRDLYQRFVIKIHHLPTEDMPADIFTKALPQEKFTKFRAILLNV